MLKRMGDMPAGTLGFEAVGEVEDDDWEREVEPVLRQAISHGDDVRLLYLLGPKAREVEDDAVKAEAGFHARHLTSYERLAVVTDEDWVRPDTAERLRGLMNFLRNRFAARFSGVPNRISSRLPAL